MIPEGVRYLRVSVATVHTYKYFQKVIESILNNYFLPILITLYDMMIGITHLYGPS